MDSPALSGSESEHSSDGDRMLEREEAVPEISSVLATRSDAKVVEKSPKLMGLRPPRTLETTLFDRLERMHGPGIKRMLKVQYRLAVPYHRLEIY